MAKALTQKQIKTNLAILDAGWELNTKGTTICREFRFRNYIEGLIFVNKLAVHAEVLDHHPDITMKYGIVKVSLITSDTKALTVLDFELAKHSDTIYTLSTETKRRRTYRQ